MRVACTVPLGGAGAGGQLLDRGLAVGAGDADPGGATAGTAELARQLAECDRHIRDLERRNGHRDRTAAQDQRRAIADRGGGEIVAVMSGAPEGRRTGCQS
jgi:hypothetical protein